MPVVIGVPRSGTTLLRLMLDAHPLLAVPPETAWLPRVASVTDREGFLLALTASPQWIDFGLAGEELAAELHRLRRFTVADGLRAFYRLYAARFDKPRWGEKTPNYAGCMETVQRVLPEACFVHVLRDGRDVVASVRHLWFRPGDSLATLAADWRERIVVARRSAAGMRRYLELRFEDLVREPEPVLRRVCAFVDLPFAAEMLAYHRRAPERLAELQTRLTPAGEVLVTREQRLANQALVLQPPQAARAGAWRETLTAAEVAEVEGEAGPLLRELGYER
jgi:hypothetical protein